MKNLLSILFLSMVTFTAFADSPTDIVDKVGDVVATVDTASLYNQMYSDVKTALVGLASALNVGAQHVYTILVKQQIVNSIHYTILILLFILLTYKTVNPMYKWANKYSGESDGFSNMLAVFYYFVLAVVGIILLFCVNTVVTGFVNPEYGAIKEIMQMIQK